MLSLAPSQRILLALLTYLSSSSSCSAVYASPTPEACKSFPSSADWPSPESWARLDESLRGGDGGGGRLLQTTTPPGAACHPYQAVYDADRCVADAAAWSSLDFHVADPVSVMWNNWSNDSCLPDPTAVACSTDGYPAFVVNATTPAHVKLAVDFARANNVRLNVKSTGHDYLGRSISPGSLSIWMHHMRDIQYHDGADGGFRLSGSDVTIPGGAVTVGGGAQMYDVYRATAEHNQTVPGGGAKTVGMGGFTTGGGHSLLSPRFGMAVDNVLQMEVVTPEGHILTLNEAQKTDLFWAIRGGGGSTFGVVTSITFATHASPSISSTAWALLVEPGAPFFADLVAFILSKFPALERAGMSMYCTSQSTAMANPFPGAGLPSQVAGIMGVSLLQDSTDPDAMNRLWQPIHETIRDRWPEATFVQAPSEFASWLDWFEANYDVRPVGTNNLLASWLLDEEALAADVDALARAVRTATDGVGRLTALLVSGKGVHEAKPRGGGNAVNPAWRRAYAHAIASKTFPSFNATAKKEAAASLSSALEGLRRLAPTMGAYVNEGFPYEENWQRTFWGDNYDRLLSIKRAVDPDNVFWCHPCVGSEGWEERNDGQLCRV